MCLIFKQMIIIADENVFLYKEGKVYKEILVIVEKHLILKALEKTKKNKLKAAKILGINRNTLYYKIKKLKIQI